MAISTIPSMALEAPPLFAGRAGPIQRVAFTGLGRPLAASTLPDSLLRVVDGAASSSPPLYRPTPTLQVAAPVRGTTVDRTA